MSILYWNDTHREWHCSECGHDSHLDNCEPFVWRANGVYGISIRVYATCPNCRVRDSVPCPVKIADEIEHQYHP